MAVRTTPLPPLKTLAVFLKASALYAVTSNRNLVRISRMYLAVLVIVMAIDARAILTASLASSVAFAVLGFTVALDATAAESSFRFQLTH